jgi:hypothetical protein
VGRAGLPTDPGGARLCCMSHAGAWSVFVAVLLFAASTLSAQAQEEAGASDVQKVGKYYVLHYHGGDEALAEQALAAVERAWPMVAGAFGVPDAVPAAPLAVHLYRTAAAYEAADKELTGGKFQRNLAMSHWGSKSSHVALQPPCTDEALRALGLPGITVELLAWEAAHLARYELCPNFPDHPDWFVDGLASSVGRAICEATYPTGNVDSLPTMATDFLSVQRLLQQKKLPPVSAILADSIEDLDFGARYAVRAVFWRFLQSDGYKSKLAKLAAAVRSTGGGSGFAKAVLGTAKTVLGSAVERDFTTFVQKAHPKWEELYRALSMHGKEWHQLAFPNRNAVAWNRDPVKGGRLYASGTLRILPGGRRQMNFLFGRTEAEDFYTLAFVADQGFTVFRFDGASGEWASLGVAKAPALRLGYTMPFSIECSGKDLLVKLDAQSWNFELPVALQKEVFWGVGVQAGVQDGPEGSAGIWGDVTVGAKKR